MDLDLTPGAIVRLPSEPGWGDGQVQSAIGHRLTVNFDHRGKVTLDTRRVRLELVRLPREPLSG